MKERCGFEVSKKRLTPVGSSVLRNLRCQTEIAAQIVAQPGDYVLELKGNQGDFHQDVQQLFHPAHNQNFRGIEHDFHETQEQGHGRQEIRCYWVMGNTEYLISAENWAKLTTIGCVES
jgi:predicted transposase YbfD/YdcC